MADHPDIPALVARLEHYARERKKLRSLDTDAIHALHSPPDPRHAELTLTDVEAAAAALSRLTRALAERDGEMRERAERAEAALERHGYRRCDIPACNCNGYHGGHLAARLDEIQQALDDADVPHDGTVKSRVLLALRERDEARAALAR